jgi:hypothetical protein
MPAEPSRVLWLALAIGAGAVLAFVLWLFVHVVTH